MRRADRLAKKEQTIVHPAPVHDPDWPKLRDAWLAELEGLSAAASTGKPGGPTTEEILEELRADRC